MSEWFKKAREFFYRDRNRRLGAKRIEEMAALVTIEPVTSEDLERQTRQARLPYHNEAPYSLRGKNPHVIGQGSFKTVYALEGVYDRVYREYHSKGYFSKRYRDALDNAKYTANRLQFAQDILHNMTLGIALPSAFLVDELEEAFVVVEATQRAYVVDVEQLGERQLFYNAAGRIRDALTEPLTHRLREVGLIRANSTFQVNPLYVDLITRKPVMVDLYEGLNEDGTLYR